MMVNANISTIFQLYSGGQFYYKVIAMISINIHDEMSKKEITSAV
jgi:hypothetical protein